MYINKELVCCDLNIVMTKPITKLIAIERLLDVN